MAKFIKEYRDDENPFYNTPDNILAEYTGYLIKHGYKTYSRKISNNWGYYLTRATSLFKPPARKLSQQERVELYQRWKKKHAAKQPERRWGDIPGINSVSFSGRAVGNPEKKKEANNEIAVARFAIVDGWGEAAVWETIAFGSAVDDVLTIVEKGKRYLIQGRLGLRRSITITRIEYRDYPAEEKTKTKKTTKKAKGEKALRTTAKRLAVSKASSK